MKNIMLYLDHAAAMEPSGEALEFFSRALRENYANQEAGHAFAHCVRKRIEAAGKELSEALTGSDRWKVVWGNSASELFALLGVSPWVKGKRCCCTPLEHPALRAALRNGVAAAAAESEFIAVTEVQSELGRLGGGSTCFSSAPVEAVRFLDAVQAAGKLPVTKSADIIALSGVKFGAPGGAALLLNPDWADGGKLAEYFHLARSRDYLGGRPNPALLLTLGHVARLRAERLCADRDRISVLNMRAREELRKLGLRLTVPPEEASPYILHCLLPGKQGAVVVRQLAEWGVMAASGSACAAESREPSPALLALGFSKAEAYSGLRLSFGFDFTAEQLNFFLVQLKNALKNY